MFTDHPDSNNLNRKWMLEMDRFVTELTGEEEEILYRESDSSLATMKEKNYGSSDLEVKAVGNLDR